MDKIEYLSIDLETKSGTDLSKSGVYKLSLVQCFSKRSSALKTKEKVVLCAGETALFKASSHNSVGDKCSFCASQNFAVMLWMSLDHVLFFY